MPNSGSFGLMVTVYDGGPVEVILAAGSTPYDDALRALTYMLSMNAVVHSISEDDFTIVSDRPLWIRDEKLVGLAPGSKFRYTILGNRQVSFNTLLERVISVARISPEQRTVNVTKYIEEKLGRICVC